MRNNLGPVRILKKVRRNFINKIPDVLRPSGNDQNIIVPIPQFLKPSSFNMIDPYFGLVEKNRKLYFGIHYVQSNFDIANISIDETPFTKVVTVTIQEKGNNGTLLYENGVKRLESYGDLSLASLGQKLKNHHSSYPLNMTKYFDLVHSGDPNVLASLGNMKKQAALIAREIESKYIYKKTLHFMDKSSSRMLSVSYSKELIEQAGYKIEEFVDYTKINGLPCIFKGDNSMYLDIMKAALSNSVSGQEVLLERPEFVIAMSKKDGTKKDVSAQTVFIVEPAREGLFLSCYSMIKSLKPMGVKISLNTSDEREFKMKKFSVQDKYGNKKDILEDLNEDNGSEIILKTEES